MKTPLLVLSLICLSVSVRAQTLSNYQATVAGQKPTYHFKLDNSLADSSATTNALAFQAVGGGFTSDYFGNANSARLFNENGDALSISNDIVAGGTGSAAGSFSFLFRYLDDTNNSGQRYLFSQGNVTTNGNAFALLLENNTEGKTDPNAIKLRVGNKTTTVLPAASLVPTNWYYLVVTYDESRKADQVKWQAGRLGEKLSSGSITIKSTAVVGDNGVFIIGNNPAGKGTYRNPGRGRVDEFAFWNRELSPAEINAQFSSATPKPKSEP